jgi:hypothetical protein
MKEGATPKETAKIRAAIKKIEKKLPHSIADIGDTAVYWEKMMPGTIGKFTWWKPWELSININHRDDPLSFILSTVIHELHHKWQFMKDPIGYVIACMTFQRNRKLEPTAIETEKEADVLLGLGELRRSDKND